MLSHRFVPLLFALSSSFAQTNSLLVTMSSSTKHEGGGRCPWPFVVFHDPVTFLCDWQTKLLVLMVGATLVWRNPDTVAALVIQLTDSAKEQASS